MTIHLFMRFFFLVFFFGLRTFVVYSEGASFLEFYFLEEPKDLVVAKGGSALFDCAVSSSSRQVEITWLKDGTLVQYDSRRHQLSNGSLYIESVEHSPSHRPDEGFYQCRASAKRIGAIVSQKATLQLHYTAMLACPVEGLPTPSVSWTRDGRPLGPSGNSDYFLHSGGSCLEILSLKASDFGSYRCQSSGSGLEVTASMQIVENTDPLPLQGVVPRFVMKPTDQNLKEGGSVTLPCAANGRDRNGKQPQITWLKDGATLELSHKDGRIGIEGQGSLRIQQLNEGDAGLYTCRATNKEDSLDVDVMLQVLVSPRFVRRPSNVEATLNSDVELECDVTAKPQASVEWLKNGDVVYPSDYFQIIEGRNLRILGLVASDEGMYQCIASNSVGNVQASAQLVIQQRASRTTTPSFQRSGMQLQPQKGFIPAVVNLTAHAALATHVTLTWKLPRPGKDSPEILGYLVTWKEDDSPRERFMNVSALEVGIRYLKPSAKYTFHVAAYGLQGVSPNSASVVVQTPASENVPGQPTNLEVTILSPTSAHVRWESPTAVESAATEPVTHYKLYYGVSDDSSGELDVNIVETQYTVTGLLKFSKYGFRVVAYNTKGPGATSARVTSHTFSDVPSSAPQNFAAEAAGSTSIVVSWEPPPDGERNGVITGYKIQYKQRREKAGNIITTDGNQHSFNISGLEKGTDYSVSVQAQTVNGSGPATDAVTAKTFMHDLDESTLPGKPGSLQVRPVANTVIVSWTPPVEQDIMIRGYVLGYGEGLPDTYRQVLDARSRHHTIRGLRASIQYVISLKAFNNIGEGLPIYDTVTTREEMTPEPQTPMMPPVGLKTVVHSSTSMTLTWTDTTLGRGQRVTDSRYYTVRYNLKFLRRFKMVNCTDLILQVDDLQPDTEYEFSVKVSRGSRQSTWSLSVFNRTDEAAPSSVPRELTVVSVRDSTSVILNWQPPKHRNGQLTGYLVYYSTDLSASDYDWFKERVNGEQLTTTIDDLSPETTYYFKVQAQNDIGYGPLSSTAIFRTPKFDGSEGGIIETPNDFHGRNVFVRPNSKNNWLSVSQTPNQDNAKGRPPTYTEGAANENEPEAVPSYLWIVIGCLAGTFLVILLVVVMAYVLCRRSSAVPNSETSDVTKGAVPLSKMPNSEMNDLKPPPDLWIHGNIEISDLDRMSDADSSTTVGRSGGRGYYDKVASDEDGYQNLSLRPFPASMMSKDEVPGHHKELMPSYEFKFPSVSNQPSRHNSLSSRIPIHQMPPRVNVADILQPGSASRPLKPPSNSKISAGTAPTTQPLISPPPVCLTSKLCDNFNSSDELTEEMANIEGLMKDLSDITRQQFSY